MFDSLRMARHALMSPAHFSREFRAAYGETPYRYLAVKAMPACVAKVRTRPTRNREAGPDDADPSARDGDGQDQSRFEEAVRAAPA